MTHFQEKILLALSRGATASDYADHGKQWPIDAALDLLIREYPNFSEIVNGKRIVDFGCGNGYQTIALAQRFNCRVTGIESNSRTLKNAIDLADSYDMDSSIVSFKDRIGPDMLGLYDVVISQNSFEHFSEPEKVFREMKSLLKSSGKLLITFGPPWLAPYGSHMQYFCKVPWVNVLFSESAVMKARSHFRSDGAKKYQDVESGLNKMTVSRFEKIISSNEMLKEYCKYSCVKNINILARIPLIREFFINHISVALTFR